MQYYEYLSIFSIKCKGDSPPILSVSSVDLKLRREMNYLCGIIKTIGNNVTNNKNELLIGFTISVILSLFANFALIMQHYELVTNSPAGDVALKQGKIELWFPLLWLFFFSFVLFILCRWIYRLGIRRFHKEVKTLGLATGICLLVACGLYKAFPFIRKSVMTQIHSDSFCVTEQAVSLSRVWTSTTPAIEKKDTLANTSPDRVHRGVIGAMTVTSNSYPLIIEHIFILLTVLLTMLLLHLFDKKQEMKLEYEK